MAGGRVIGERRKAFSGQGSCWLNGIIDSDSTPIPSTLSMGAFDFSVAIRSP